MIMRECKSVGPNLKTYFYYINEAATKPDVKGVIVLAHGMEGTGAVYDVLGEYLDYEETYINMWRLSSW